MSAGAAIGRSRRIVLRLGWGVSDQALCSITNLALGALVAHAVAPSAFGAFGLALSAYLIVLGACRALVAEPLVVRYSAAKVAERQAATRAAAGAAIALGLAAGFCCVAAGLIGGGVFSQALLALGPMLPFLVLQDTWRYAFFAAGRGALAFLNDLACTVVLIPALVALGSTTRSITPFILVWGAAGALGAVLGAFQARVAPAPLATSRWLRAQRDLAFPYLGEFVALSGGEFALFGVGGLIGLTAVGALRAAQILLGPLRVLFIGVRLVAIPDGVRLLLEPNARPRTAAAVLSGTLAGTALAWGATVLVLPPSVGHMLLGRSWSEAQSVIVPLSIAMAGTGAVTGPFVGLRALAAARRSLRSRLIVAPFMFLGAVLGAVVGGAPGAASGTALVIWLSVGLWWREFGKALEERSGAAVAAPSSRLRAAGRWAS